MTATPRRASFGRAARQAANWHARCFHPNADGEQPMSQSKILGSLAPRLCLVGFAACAQSDPKPPQTHSSYTHKPPTSRHTASRPEQKARSRVQEASKQEAPPPVVTGTEGDDSRTAITLARCQ